MEADDLVCEGTPRFGSALMRKASPESLRVTGVPRHETTRETRRRRRSWYRPACCRSPPGWWKPLHAQPGSLRWSPPSPRQQPAHRIHRFFPVEDVIRLTRCDRLLRLCSCRSGQRDAGGRILHEFTPAHLVWGPIFLVRHVSLLFLPMLFLHNAPANCLAIVFSSDHSAYEHVRLGAPHLPPLPLSGRTLFPCAQVSQRSFSASARSGSFSERSFCSVGSSARL